MSEERPAHAWRFYVEDMVAFCGDVLDYTEGFNSTSFDKNQMRYDAIFRKLELSAKQPRTCRTTCGSRRLTFRGDWWSLFAIA